MSCGCDSTKTNIAGLPEWDAATTYTLDQRVRYRSRLFIAQPLRIEMVPIPGWVSPFPGMPTPQNAQVQANIGRAPLIDFGLFVNVNDAYWREDTNCYDGSATQCQQTILPPPNVVEVVNPAAGIVSSTNQPIGFTEPPIIQPPPPPALTSDELEEKRIAELPQPAIPIPSFKDMIQNTVGDIDSRTAIMGLGGILALILIFKK